MTRRRRSTLDTPLTLYADNQRSEHTAKNARYRLQAFAKWLKAAHRISDLERVETRHILGYKQHIADQGLAPSTQARIIETLRGFFRWAHAEGLIGRDPAAQVKSPRPTLNQEPQYLELADTRKLIKAAKSDRDQAMVWALSYGLRVGEVAGLNVGDLIEPSKRSELPGLRITGKGTRQRIIPIADQAFKAIKKYLKSRGDVDGNDPLLTCTYAGDDNRRMTTRALQKIFARLCEKAGIDSGKAHPHAARHGAAMRWLYQTKTPGGIYTVSKLLGHGSISTTERYLHIRRDAMEKAVINDPLAR